MIIDFTIKNYRSFKKTASISLLAEPLKNDGIAISTTDFKDDILPVAGIFGQNAGGKSNIIKALSYMTDSMLNADHIGSPINKNPLLQPFLLNANNSNQPIHFELSLWDKDTVSQYNYGFEVDDSGIVSEWLSLSDRPKTNRRSRMIFERSRNNFTFDSTVKRDLEPLSIRVLDTALAVNVFAQLADPYSNKLLEIVREQIKIIDSTDADKWRHYILERCLANEELKARVIRFIRKLDIGINDIRIDKSEIDTAELPEGAKFGFRYRVESSHFIYDDRNNRLKESRNFNFGDESLGTQRIFILAVVLLDALNKGEMVVIDELGSSLHPFLTKRIVEIFQNPELNKYGAQLIFTSHETFLLAKNSLNGKLDLRRDQIWFADKGADEASVLRCLSEYKTKKEYDLAKRYLEGRFGAVPVVKSWEA
ncbi:MAG: ATP-binding protein [Candidatus Nanosynbacter sp.]|jgi:hypothetical protein|nr:ATP-binding protein [Candidatus Nanosynbacter sp.]